MTTLELYSVYERGVIMVAKGLKKYLEEKGHTIAVNNPEPDLNLHFTDYQMRLKTMYCHTYKEEPFVSDEMPNESDGFIFFTDVCDEEFPIMVMNLCDTFNSDPQNTIEIDINICAYLLADNKTIEPRIELYPYDRDRFQKVTWKLQDWKESLKFFSEYVKDIFEEK